MTLDKFLDKLRETPREWHLSESGCLRLSTSCPITAIRRLDSGFVHSEAITLGLSAELTERIIYAADGYFADPDLRRQLLEACGL
jgi:hypothetical protein